jgi:hypothetical protein
MDGLLPSYDRKSSSRDREAAISQEADMAWGKAKDDLAGDKALKDQERFGKVVDRLETNGHLKAAKNVTAGAGRGDSPEELQRRVDTARNNRGGGQER